MFGVRAHRNRGSKTPVSGFASRIWPRSGWQGSRKPLLVLCTPLTDPIVAYEAFGTSGKVSGYSVPRRSIFEKNVPYAWTANILADLARKVAIGGTDGEVVIRRSVTGSRPNKFGLANGGGDDLILHEGCARRCQPRRSGGKASRPTSAPIR